MSKIHLLDTGLVYRNPKPHLRAIHTWHPSIVALPSGELLSTFDLGQGSESMDYRTWLSRSKDGGKTWTEPQRLVKHPTKPDGPHTARLGRMRDGTLVAMGLWFQRDNPEEGLVNRANFGFVPGELFQVTSKDEGRTWSAAEVKKAPLHGPSFEPCHAIVELADGRWVWPTSTWRGWNGDEPHGMRAIALVSKDRGASWSEWMDVIDQRKEGFCVWEQSLVQMKDGRLVAIGWRFDEKAGKSAPNVYAMAKDGKTFGPARPLGINGETAKILRLPDERLVCLFRGIDQPGLLGAVLKFEGEELRVVQQQSLWRGSTSTVQNDKLNPSDSLSWLKFGYPQMTLLADGSVFAVFWCAEDCIQNIRWLRLRVE